MKAASDSFIYTSISAQKSKEDYSNIKYDKVHADALDCVYDNNVGKLEKLILEHKIDINQLIGGSTLLQTAASLGASKIVQVLLVMNADTNIKDDFGHHTALDIAKAQLNAFLSGEIGEPRYLGKIQQANLEAIEKERHIRKKAFREIIELLKTEEERESTLLSSQSEKDDVFFCELGGQLEQQEFAYTDSHFF